MRSLDHISTILVQGAMDIEIEYLLTMCRPLQEIKLYAHLFFAGRIGEKKIILSKTGAGTVNATIATVLGITRFSPDLLINQGIAGGSTKAVHTGEIIIGAYCRNIHSYTIPYRKEGDGSHPFGWKPTKRGKEVFAGDIETAKNLLSFVETNYSKPVHVGTLGSGDCFNREADRILWMHDTFGVLSEDMESIGAYSASQELGVPCIGVRILSNNELLHEPLDKTQAAILQKLLIAYLKGSAEKMNPMVPIHRHEGEYADEL